LSLIVPQQDNGTGIFRPAWLVKKIAIIGRSIRERTDGFMKERKLFLASKCLLLILLLASISAGSTGNLAQLGRPASKLLNAGSSGLWFNLEQSGHGLVVEVIDTNTGPKLLVYWFAYLDTEQVWMGGVGEIDGDSATVTMNITSGGRFPPDFDPSTVVNEIWGELTLVFQGDNNLQATWLSDFDGFNNGSLPMTRLTRVGSNADGAGCLSGAYFNAEQDGHGILVDVSKGQSGEDIAVVTWFTFANNGSQAWLQGHGVLSDNEVQLSVLIPMGGDFPPGFDSNEVRFEPWGTLSLSFAASGGAVELVWESDFADFADGSLGMERLTILSEHPCAGMETPPYASIDPSGGSGGDFPGFIDLQVTVAGLGLQEYFLFVPETYRPEQSMPLMLVWHGAAGPGNASAAAQQVLHLWSDIAAAEGFLLVAQVATGGQGGWIPNNSELIMDAIFAELESSYNVDRGRQFGWGFSAGGHVMHDLVLGRADQFAAYAVNAGVLDAFAGGGAPAAATRQIPVSITVGNQDPLQPFALLDRQRFEDAGWIPGENLFYQEFSGGHTVSFDQLNEHWQQLKHFIRPFSLGPAD
jgi:poly(3-hydroxybutyrate) depolymerase